MAEGTGPQEGLAAELAEWWEDLCRRHTGSRVILVRLPGGWGRSTVLDRFAAGIATRIDAPVTLTARIDGKAVRALGTAGLRSRALARMLQVQVLRAELGGVAEQHRALELLGLNEPGGQVQLGLGVAVLFFSGLTAGISFLLAGIAAGAVGRAWDDSPTGQDGALARTARAVAKVSAQAPVTVVIDDADCLDEDFAVTLVENLTARHDGQVLIVAVVDPDSALAGAIRSRVRRGSTIGLVHDAEANPDMGYGSRLDLARQLHPNLPDAGARRIADRTGTFGEVFTVAAAPRLAEIGPGEDEDAVRAVVDAAADSRLTRPVPSPEATVLAWAGGLVHALQADRALGILGATRHAGDRDVRRWESLERLADPTTPRLADQVAAGLTGGQRHDMAAAFLQEALTIAQNPDANLISKVAALQAVHRVRADLPASLPLPRVQRELVAALEDLGDHAAALEVAATAVAEWPPGTGDANDRDALVAAALRLSLRTKRTTADLLARQLIAEAITAGAVTGLEAKVWAAAILLGTPDQREAALSLAYQAAADLDALPDLGQVGDGWRLLLARRAAGARQPSMAGQLLSPLLASNDPVRHHLARAILDAADGPRADIRLQNILLADTLAVLPPDADDDRLRLHHALAANYDTLGDYPHARDHAKQELGYHLRIHGPAHPDTLTTRARLAHWTGHAGDPVGALGLYKDLLPSAVQVFGPDHRETLAVLGEIASLTGDCGDPAGALALWLNQHPVRERTLGLYDEQTLIARNNIAHWTMKCGDARRALDLYRQLLPDKERVLGTDHLGTLTTRINIASLTGECGDSAGALTLYKELLPDEERVLGHDHPLTMLTRNNIAFWTDECGDAAAALALYRDVLPDRERVLGADHPDTLHTRSNIAVSAARCGDAAGALDLSRELLPNLASVLGEDHPDILTLQNNIASLTGQCGDSAGALAMHRELLFDRQRVLGPDHPDTLGSRINIAYWSWESGDHAVALALYRELLPDMERVLGRDHPTSLATRNSLAHSTSEYGDYASALTLWLELLPGLERVFGLDHLNTLTVRGNIARMTEACGDHAEALALYRKLLPDVERVLGTDHAVTFTIRNSMAESLTQRSRAGCRQRAQASFFPISSSPDRARSSGVMQTRNFTVASNSTKNGSARAGMRDGSGRSTSRNAPRRPFCSVK